MASASMCRGLAARPLLSTQPLLSAALRGFASAAHPALAVGAAFTRSRTFSADDAAAWASLTGDANPIHVQTDAAAAAGHAAPILPGLLLASLFPAIIGSTFPGALYLGQSLKFRAAARVGCNVEARVTVAARSGSRVTFDTAVREAGSGRVLVDGSALAIIRGPS